ncbi:uncharacterized protein MONOS_708 [Monocercomonoides exilis]|uniref:uncharacterized protein n=1 Tax=Monocercomonoides exilis TaxID=2049356 RepID=UPI00355A81D2|nr:hypothetical protein MONOS_708 [Monocercomonoides exilis]|eukprot:MONOS_708.1-p1 / transcript=MONOS_708.1 / gene=MONOS_708 / organism=Monocercomonoides_exilis_PA203 / gene_product=unspecified product / transcript_product=unspecified product / location=Mono_scaffold00012:20159-26496(+) / protein_length=1836 / sequence_SO=supercontig / SO=protein_coding / is_pseudo=false
MKSTSWPKGGDNEFYLSAGFAANVISPKIRKKLPIDLIAAVDFSSKDEDRFGLVLFAGKPITLIEPTFMTLKSKELIIRRLMSFTEKPQGGTNILEGIGAALDLMSESEKDGIGGVRHMYVWLFSDGIDDGAHKETEFGSRGESLRIEDGMDAVNSRLWKVLKGRSVCENLWNDEYIVPEIEYRRGKERMDGKNASSPRAGSVPPSSPSSSPPASNISIPTTPHYSPSARSVTSTASTSPSASRKKRRFLRLFTFGFGVDHDDVLLSAIATAGKGNYYFIDTEGVFVRSVCESLVKKQNCTVVDGVCEIALEGGWTIEGVVGRERVINRERKGRDEGEKSALGSTGKRNEQAWEEEKGKLEKKYEDEKQNSSEQDILRVSIGDFYSGLKQKVLFKVVPPLGFNGAPNTTSSSVSDCLQRPEVSVLNGTLTMYSIDPATLRPFQPVSVKFSYNFNQMEMMSPTSPLLTDVERAESITQQMACIKRIAGMKFRQQKLSQKHQRAGGLAMLSRSQFDGVETFVPISMNTSSSSTASLSSTRSSLNDSTPTSSSSSSSSSSGSASESSLRTSPSRSSLASSASSIFSSSPAHPSPWNNPMFNSTNNPINAEIEKLTKRVIKHMDERKQLELKEEKSMAAGKYLPNAHEELTLLKELKKQQEEERKAFSSATRPPSARTPRLPPHVTLSSTLTSTSANPSTVSPFLYSLSSTNPYHQPLSRTHHSPRSPHSHSHSHRHRSALLTPRSLQSPSPSPSLSPSPSPSRNSQSLSPISSAIASSPAAQEELGAAIASVLSSEKPPLVIEQNVRMAADAMCERMEDELKEEMKEEMKEELKDSVREEVKEEVKEEIKEEMKEELKMEVREELKEQLLDAVDEMKAELDKEIVQEAAEGLKEEMRDEMREELEKVIREERLELIERRLEREQEEEEEREGNEMELKMLMNDWISRMRKITLDSIEEVERMKMAVQKGMGLTKRENVSFSSDGNRVVNKLSQKKGKQKKRIDRSDGNERRGMGVEEGEYVLLDGDEWMDEAEESSSSEEGTASGGHSRNGSTSEKGKKSRSSTSLASEGSSSPLAQSSQQQEGQAQPSSSSNSSSSSSSSSAQPENKGEPSKHSHLPIIIVFSIVAFFLFFFSLVAFICAAPLLFSGNLLSGGSALQLKKPLTLSGGGGSVAFDVSGGGGAASAATSNTKGNSMHTLSSYNHLDIKSTTSTWISSSFSSSSHPSHPSEFKQRSSSFKEIGEAEQQNHPSHQQDITSQTTLTNTLPENRISYFNSFVSFISHSFSSLRRIINTLFSSFISLSNVLAFHSYASTPSFPKSSLSKPYVRSQAASSTLSINSTLSVPSLSAHSSQPSNTITFLSHIDMGEYEIKGLNLPGVFNGTMKSGNALQWTEGNGVIRAPNKILFEAAEVQMDDLRVEDKLTVDGTMSVRGNATFGESVEAKDVRAYNSTVLRGSVRVEGETHFVGKTVAEGDVAVEGVLSGKDGTFSGDVSVAGEAKLKKVRVEAGASVEGGCVVGGQSGEEALRVKGKSVLEGGSEVGECGGSGGSVGSGLRVCGRSNLDSEVVIGNETTTAAATGTGTGNSDTTLLVVNGKAQFSGPTVIDAQSRVTGARSLTVHGTTYLTNVADGHSSKQSSTHKNTNVNKENDFFTKHAHDYSKCKRNIDFEAINREKRNIQSNQAGSGNASDLSQYALVVDGPVLFRQEVKMEQKTSLAGGRYHPCFFFDEGQIENTTIIKGNLTNTTIMLEAVFIEPDQKGEETWVIDNGTAVCISASQIVGHLTCTEQPEGDFRCTYSMDKDCKTFLTATIVKGDPEQIEITDEKNHSGTSSNEVKAANG